MIRFRIYHFKTKRKFGNLFSNDPSKGCTTIHPGIGDVMYVKDGTTGRIVTANFSCSKFGTHSHNSLGWVLHCIFYRCLNTSVLNCTLFSHCSGFCRDVTAAIIT